MEDIYSLILYAVPVIFAITVHEAAHGYTAKYFGDNTAWNLGRVTLNPLKHIDPIGTILMPIGLYFMTNGQFMFGYAKPVPVNFGRLKNPKRDGVLVAFAGPLSNLIMAFLWVLIYKIAVQSFGVDSPALALMCKGGLVINTALFALNMLPLLPLDGGRILSGFLPSKYAYEFSKIEPYGFFIVIALMVTGILSSLWMIPIMNALHTMIFTFL